MCAETWITPVWVTQDHPPEAQYFPGVPKRLATDVDLPVTSKRERVMSTAEAMDARIHACPLVPNFGACSRPLLTAETPPDDRDGHR